MQQEHDPYGGMTREEWLVSRSKGIGGSEAAALFDVHPWVSRFSLYQTKVGGIKDDKDSPAMRWGRRLEPVVREAYEEEVERVVGPGVINAKHPDPSLSFVIANTDGTIEPVPEHNGRGVYEGKASLTPFKRHEWDEGVPLYYQVQTQHYMAVTGYEWASVCVFIPGGGDPLLFCDIHRNDAFIDALMEREHDFWVNHVMAGVAPDPDGSKATTNALKLLHPKDNGEILFMPEEATQWSEQLNRIKSRMKELAEDKKLIENQIRAAIGENTFGVLPSGEGWSYKHQHRGAYTVEAQDIRVLRRASKKAIDKAKSMADAAAEEAIESAGLSNVKL